MSAAFETLKSYYEDRTKGAKEWQNKGGKVMGYTCPHTPLALIYAAGLMPLRVVGDPNIEPTIVRKYMEDFTSPWVFSVYDLILKHKFDYLDGWVGASSNDSIIKLNYAFSANPETAPKNYFWLDIPHSAHMRNYKYALREIKNFKSDLEKTYQVQISDESLKKAMKVYNEGIKLRLKLAELRREQSPRISGKEAYIAHGAGFWMPPEEYNQVLAQFLADVETSAKHYNGPRIFVSGSTMHNTGFVNAVEETGVVIIADDIDTGNRFFDELIPEEPLMSPLENITEHLLWKLHDPGRWPMWNWVDYFKAKVKEANADGVIFNIIKWEDLPGFYYPTLKAELDKMNIPSLLLEMQEYRLAAPERLKIRIETFSEMLMQKSPVK